MKIILFINIEPWKLFFDYFLEFFLTIFIQDVQMEIDELSHMFLYFREPEKYLILQITI